MALYGTPQEVRDVALLEALGFDVDNPNNPVTATRCLSLHESGVDSGAIMERVFKPRAETCDVLVFRALPDGSIPAGVAKEIEWALAAGKPVIELPSGFRRRVLTVEQTREYLAEVGQR
jgi:hypothetical protein